MALATNFIYFHYAAADYFFPDSFTYLAPAHNLLQGLGFVNPPGVVDTLRTPGYPLLLAVFGTRIVPVIVAQHLLNAAIAVAVYLIALRRTNRFIAFVAALLVAVDTPTIHYANKILTETFFTAVLLIVFVLLLERRALPVAALLTGALVLIRPVAIAWFLVAGLYLMLRRVRLRDVVIFLLLAALPPAAWAVRNRVRTGVFTVSSISGTNLLTFRAAGVLAILDHGDDFQADLADEQQGLIEDADAEIERDLRIDDAREIPHAVRSRYFTRIALRVIGQHPAALAELTLRGLLVNIFDSRWIGMAMVSPLDGGIVRMVIDALTAAMFIFFIIGSRALWKRDRDLALLILLTVSYFLLISAGGESEARFRVPVIPQYAIAAAAGLQALRRAATPEPR